jgi:DNA-directed RNA polymerase sigma subunit (sigma70/sigma32)
MHDLKGEQYEPLSLEEELKLWRAIEAWKPGAQEKLINHNMRFVFLMAKKFYDPKLILELPDLVSAGYLWLRYAVNRRDYRKWNKLLSYAVYAIAWAIIRKIYTLGRVVRIPLSKRKEIESLLQQVSNNPDITLNSLIDTTILDHDTKTRLMFALEAHNSTYYTDVKYNVVCDDDWFYKPEYGMWWEDIRELISKTLKDDPYYELDRIDLQEDIRRFIDHKLTGRIREIICHTYGILWYEKMTIEELSKKYNRSKTMMVLERNKWTRILKESVYKDILKKYLG